MIKQLKKEETPLFTTVVDSYQQHLMRHPQSLLIKYFGLFKIHEDVFVLMQNVFFPPAVKLVALPKQALTPAKIFDLKGSTVGRTAREGERVLKDNNCRRTFSFDSRTRGRIYNALKCDSDFLRDCGFLDYSLVVGITDVLQHTRKPHNKNTETHETTL